MATSFIFDGRNIKIPGAYSVIKSGIKTPPSSLTYGNTVIIDTGIGATWGGGAGSEGTLENGKDAVYTFFDLESFRQHVSGGILWDIAEKLFKPASVGVQGVSSLSIIRAATTVPATLDYTFTGGVGNGGTLEITCKAEGVVGNGTVTSTKLVKGFAGLMSAGRLDPTKFILSFYKTGFKGNDSSGDPFDYITAANAKPVLLAQSIEFSNIAEAIAWMNTDSVFNAHFKLTGSSVAGTGVVDADDLGDYPSYSVFTGGTETYDADGLTVALDALADFDIDFILADKFGPDDHDDANNTAIFNWIANESKTQPDLYIAGGNDATKFNQADGSIEVAEHYDSQFVTVVHSGIKKNTPLGVKNRSAFYTAATVLGREAGLPPQVPLTFKDIAIDGLQHQMNKKQIELGLDKGVLMIKEESGSFDIVKGINTLQNNANLINPDGTTSSKQVRRVARQINKELVFNIKRDLLKNPVGVNRATLTDEDVKSYVQGYLRSITATELSDNLILGFQNTTVALQGDAYLVNYEIITNREISFVFATGVIVE